VKTSSSGRRSCDGIIQSTTGFDLLKFLMIIALDVLSSYGKVKSAYGKVITSIHQALAAKMGLKMIHPSSVFATRDSVV
jgi:hypothetical protein